MTDQPLAQRIAEIRARIEGKRGDGWYGPWVGDMVFLLDALTAREQARQQAERKLEREGIDRCAAHPNEALVLVCPECFESDKTAEATARAEQAEQELAALKKALEGK